jgi:hypothetical protein
LGSTTPTLTGNDLIVGLALALLGLGFAFAYGRTHGIAWDATTAGPCIFGNRPGRSDESVTT